MVSGQIQHTCVVTAAPEKTAWLWCLVDYISDFTPTAVSFQVLSEITGNNNIIPAYSNTKHLILYSLEYSSMGAGVQGIKTCGHTVDTYLKISGVLQNPTQKCKK